MLLRWHDLFTFLGLSSGSGLNWSLSIIFLVITARLLLFRFFLKQVHYQPVPSDQRGTGLRLLRVMTGAA